MEGGILDFLLNRLLCLSNALRGPNLSLFEERLGRKTNQGDCGPLESPGVIVTPTGRTLCKPFRDDISDAIKSAAALRLSPCLCVLRCG